MRTLKISKKKIEELNKKYFFEKKWNKNYFYFYKKINKITISIFSTNLIRLQGNENEINTFLKNENLKNENNFIFEHVGGDESGVGDYFGPIVLTLFKYTENLKNLNIFNKIKDSKKLSDNSIKKIAGELIKLKNHFKTYIISNKELNESHENNINSKEILAIYYSKLLENKIFKSNKKIIIDGFVTKTTFNNYCIKNNIKIRSLELIKKAEDNFLGVATASIISRFYFLEEIKKIEKILNLKIKLGASSEVKKQVKEILQKKNIKDAKKYIKLFFKI